MIHRSHKLSAMLPDVLRCESNDSDGYAQDWHAHDCHMLLLPRHGSLSLATENSHGRTLLSNLSFSIIVPDVGHATCARGRASHLALYIDPDYLRHYGNSQRGMDLVSAIAGHGQWRRSQILDSIITLHQQLSAADHTASQHHLNHLLFEECMRIVASHPAVPPGKDRSNTWLIGQVCDFISADLQAHHEIDELCRQFHLSRRHLTRLFRAVRQETIVDYANRQRVEQARRLILDHGMSILDAGLSVGIDTPSYLTRLFRKHLGVRPSELRRN
ncbi:helix-turn-helix transcriptional regulator [Janthinobacterium agaricidamnosum]|uniref:Bacterial regulatory helix-turn-helix s, AraC family protein n=1 Tax=Janthinobacterium agaricidamnosum NBRC 102515 = DSM 9628 TaxID=1349767 RepID=W0VAN5_9BURK|nr:helix-turn-helix domain-containing protein [Janthinobacterium agaricidamnosum]CDG84418.1 bacterial regulatory helix-turn-helix s, AraC family protein [Janthinobacterium agaricidamnosum NBRC 102515 = DSM 9628]